MFVTILCYFSRILEVAAALCIGFGGAGTVANKTVRIYERVKVQGKWTDRSVAIPKLKADGTMYLTHGVRAYASFG